MNGATRKVVKKSADASMACSRSAGLPGSDMVFPHHANVVSDLSGDLDPSAAGVATAARISSSSATENPSRWSWAVVP